MVRKIIRNKKASIQDLIFIVITLVGAGLMILFFAHFMGEFNTEIQSMDQIPTEGKVAINDINNLNSGAIDNSFLFLTIGLAFVAFLFAFLVVVHPVFFVLYFLVLTLVIYIAGIASNIYQTAAETAVLQSTAQSLVFTTHILSYLPIITGILGMLLAIVMYKVRSNATQGGL